MDLAEWRARLPLMGLSAADMNLKAWRFMPLSKFMSLLEYQALWFSKLFTLERLEGMIPAATKARMQLDDQKWKDVLPPEVHDQVDNFANRNEEDGRELTVVNCWFLGSADTRRMWQEYALSLTEGVAVVSTVQRLVDAVFVPRDHFSRFGRVTYVQHAQHEMSSYLANQAVERAFLKDMDYSHEHELRIATLSLKGTHCVRPDGEPYRADEVQGKDMNNFDRPGVYIRANLNRLIDSVVVSPEAQDWFLFLIRRLLRSRGFTVPVTRSTSTL